MYKVLDLFSGIGGFSLGLERTGGFETVAFCEIEPYCQKVLKKHWPKVPCYEDIRCLTADRLRGDGIRPDIITGGFPCQDISTAGKQAGIEGERSGLWRELSRLIGELRPRYAILENVSALLRNGFGKVIGDLAALRYDTEWQCIRASRVGLPHARDRVWIMAYPNKGRCKWKGVSLPRQGQQEENNESECGRDMSLSIEIGRQMDGTNGASSLWRETESRMVRTLDGVPNRAYRIAALGNSVVPQIPELIGRAILEYENAQT